MGVSSTRRCTSGVEDGCSVGAVGDSTGCAASATGVSSTLRCTSGVEDGCSVGAVGDSIGWAACRDGCVLHAAVALPAWRTALQSVRSVTQSAGLLPPQRACHPRARCTSGVEDCSVGAADDSTDWAASATGVSSTLRCTSGVEDGSTVGAVGDSTGWAASATGVSSTLRCTSGVEEAALSAWSVTQPAGLLPRRVCPLRCVALPAWRMTALSARSVIQPTGAASATGVSSTLRCTSGVEDGCYCRRGR